MLKVHLTGRCALALWLALAVLAAVSAPALASGSDGGLCVLLWNNFCRSIEEQNATLTRLQDSLKANHPSRVRDERRRAMYTDAIRLGEEQTELLRKMRRAEFGNEGDGESSDLARRTP